MSLVHDALEKAKREASAKSAKELGLSESRIGAGQPFRSQRRLHPVAVAAIAVAITLAAVAGIAFWPKANVESPLANATPERQAVPTEPAALPVIAPTPAPIAPVTDAAPPAPSLPSVAASTTQLAPSAPQAPAADQTDATASTPIAPSAASSPKTPTQTAKSFVRQLTLGDGTVVRLGGIAWSQEAPLAYLNGKLYAKGESVAGLTIEAIERDRVVLVGGSGRVYLKLK